MIAYEFYWRNKAEKEHLIGILPERRKNRKRITESSILNWGRKLIGDGPDIRDIYFVKVDT